MIDLPTPELSEEWTRLDPRVRLVVEAIEELAAGYGLPVVVTSLLRTKSAGPHHDGRACDLSVKHLPEALVREILELRHRFPYGAAGFSSVVLESPQYQDLAVYGWDGTRDRPWLLQNSRATGPHLHIQVPPGETNWQETLPDECYDTPDRLVVAPISRKTITVHLDYIIPTGGLLSAHEILRQPAEPAEGEDMEKDNIMDGLTDQELGDLTPGPRGYQREPGFEIVGEPIVMPVVAVMCKSSRHPVPQLRYLSPHELERGVLEVADRMYCLRVHGRLVIGRMDDVAEIAADEARGIAFGFSLSGAARLVQWVAGLVLRIKGAVAKL